MKILIAIVFILLILLQIGLFLFDFHLFQSPSQPLQPMPCHLKFIALNLNGIC